MGKQSMGNGAVDGTLVPTEVTVTPGATPALDLSQGSLFLLTPAQNETLSAINLTEGEEFQLVVTTSGSSSYTLTFGTGFLTTGTLATGTVTAKNFVVNFRVVDGVATEVSRTTAM